MPNYNVTNKLSSPLTLGYPPFARTLAPGESMSLTIPDESYHSWCNMAHRMVRDGVISIPKSEMPPDLFHVNSEAAPAPEGGDASPKGGDAPLNVASDREPAAQQTVAAPPASANEDLVAPPEGKSHAEAIFDADAASMKSGEEAQAAAEDAAVTAATVAAAEDAKAAEAASKDSKKKKK